MTDDTSPEDLRALYQNRFDQAELADKRLLWGVLVTHWFQRYVPADGTVLDLGAGTCEFVNEIAAARRIAVDLNPDTGAHAAPGVEVMITNSEDLSGVTDGSVDVVFTSNFFEHLPTKVALLNTLAECRRVLVPSGRLIVLMPNIRYLAGRYWDYFDHHLPLTHFSLVEALELSGFEAEEVIPRFLPYTVKGGRLPVRGWLIRGYLRIRPAWRVLGRQMLVVGRVRV